MIEWFSKKGSKISKSVESIKAITGFGFSFAFTTVSDWLNSLSK